MPSAHWLFLAPRTMQIADFIIGLSGHLWLHFNSAWLLISIQTKYADNKNTFPLSRQNKKDAIDYKKSEPRDGYVKGQDMQFIPNYNSTTSTVDVYINQHIVIKIILTVCLNIITYLKY